MTRYHLLTPLVVSARKPSEFTIAAVSDSRLLRPGSRYSISVNGVLDFRHNQDYTMEVSSEASLSFRFTPPEPGEYTVGLHREGSTWPSSPLHTLRFYAVPSALQGQLPFKGDLHIHTTASGDGHHSTPYMVATAREVGMDFAAITDHRCYQPSLDAISWAGEIGADILLYPGEEVNFSLGLGHILSLCANRAISERFQVHETDDPVDTSGGIDQMQILLDQVSSKYGAELADLGTPTGADPDLYGYLFGIVQEIKKAGGLAVIAHPYWRSRGVFDLVRSTYEAALGEKLFDAVELLGDSSLEDTVLSITRGAAKEGLSVLGNSDAHRAEHVGERYTIVFAPKCTAEAVVRAIRTGRTTACAALAASKPLLSGDYQLVEYAYFLINEFFPLHDELCRALGMLYKAQVGGPRENLRPAMDFLQSQIGDLYRSRFCF